MLWSALTYIARDTLIMTTSWYTHELFNTRKK